jgi:hypothetical protein
VPSASLAVEWIPIERIFLSPSNPRINDPAVDHVAASMRKFNWQQPIVAKRSGEVIAGNTRLKAAKSLGLTSVPVVWFEGTDLEATAYQVADNVTLSTWDEPALAKILQYLRAEEAWRRSGSRPRTSTICLPSSKPASARARSTTRGQGSCPRTRSPGGGICGSSGPTGSSAGTAPWRRTSIGFSGVPRSTS